MTPSAKREAVARLTREHSLSVRRACGARAARCDCRGRPTAYHRPLPNRAAQDQPVIDALQAVVADRPRIGFWQCFDRLRLGGKAWNHKRVHRVYCALRLNLPRRTRKRLVRAVQHPLAAPPRLNHIWALDCMTDTLYDGRRFRTLNIWDEGNREALTITAGTSRPSRRVIAVLDALIALPGQPAALRMDNGPEFTSRALTTWCEKRDIKMRCIQPGKPQQNAYIERFNRSYRTEVLDAYLCEMIPPVPDESERWLAYYHTERPHDSLGRVPPQRFLPRSTSSSPSTFKLST